MAHAVKEVPQHLSPAGRMHDLGVKLDAEDSVAVRERGHRRVATRGERVKSRRQLADVIAMAHPDRELRVQALEKGVGLPDSQQRGPVLAGVPRIDFATQVMGDQLHAVADTEDGDTGPKGLGVDLWRSEE